MQQTPLKPLAALVLMSSVALATQSPPQQPNVSPNMSDAEFADAVGGKLSTGTGPTLRVRGKLRDPNSNNPTATAYKLTLTKTSSFWEEDFLFALPHDTSVRDSPLLVLWHGWSSSEENAWNHTSFFEEAAARNWYVIAPLGAHEWHLGIDYAQMNIEEVAEFMANLVAGLTGYPAIDRTRVYGVGFSMGAGALTSYACRHLDPTGLPYAAFVNYTGTMSAARGWQKLRPDKYNPSNNNAEFRNHPLMFGGSPNFLAFAYQIASCIHLWPNPAIVDPSGDLLRNIPALPVYTVSVSLDLHDNVDQCDLAYSHALSLGFPVFQRWYLPPDPAWPPKNGPNPYHCWEHLPEDLVCNWFDQPSMVFQRPTGHTRILADRNARYYDISVTQANQGVLSPFEYDVTNVQASNTLELTTSQETSALQIHTLDMGLKPPALLTLNLGGPVGSPAPVTLKLTDYTAVPGTVLRNGVPNPGGWWWSGSPSHTLTLVEPNPGANPSWTIQ